jgi:hypothetical protein
MLKKIMLFAGLSLLSSFAFAQRGKKLTKEESASMTSEQRLVHETNRKSKHGKKNVSLKKKIKISKQQDRRSRRIKKPR